MKTRRRTTAMISSDDALTLAINLLRDSAESGRMPSGVVLEPPVVALHEQAADELAALRDQFRTTQPPR